MPMYKWRVRTYRISHDYIEEIVEAKSAEEAEAKVDPYGYGDRAYGWQIDENPEVFINDDYTERMDKLYPEDYANPDDDEGTLSMSQHDRGYLYAKGETMELLLNVDDEPWDDEWKQVQTPCENWYDINLWRDDITDRVHCTVYKVDFKDGVFTTDTTDWTRLW
jgi:hypothetical protein